MLSERIIAQHFHAVWAEYFPLMTPTFMSMFNRAYKLDIVNVEMEPLGAIEVGNEIKSPDLVAEVAFHIARLSFSEGITVDNLKESAHYRSDALECARRAVPKAAGGADRELLNPEWDEVFRLSERYELFLRNKPKEAIEYCPRIPGAGVIGACTADLSVDSTLIEVKTVNRNIGSRDLRQLIVYLALQNASSVQRWEYGCFLNPRLGLSYPFSIDSILRQISGGRTTSDVLRGLLEEFSERSIVLDCQF